MGLLSFFLFWEKVSVLRVVDSFASTDKRFIWPCFEIIRRINIRIFHGRI